MDEQHIRLKAILEIVGKPKEYVEKKSAEYAEKLKEDENVMVLNQQINEAKEQEGIWSTYTEVELIAKGTANVVGFCIEYMPSSVDIIKPEKFVFEQRGFTSFINDMLAKLHQVDMITKQLGTENSFLKQNMNKLLSNTLIVMVKLGVNNLENLSKATGIEQDEIKIMLEHLIKDRKIKEEGEVYSLP